MLQWQNGAVGKGGSELLIRREGEEREDFGTIQPGNELREKGDVERGQVAATFVSQLKLKEGKGRVSALNEFW